MRVKPVALALCLAQPLAAQELRVPQFAPQPIAPHVYGGGWEHFVGGGVASFDCDGDAKAELYAAGGENPAQLFRNRSGSDNLSLQAETPEVLSLTGVIGAYPLDINGDGLIDLAILRVGQDALMEGLGACQFAPFDDLGFDSGDHWSTAFSATWEAGQTLPTLAIGTYVDRSNPDGPFEACDDTLLFRPDGDRYRRAERLVPGFCALSMLFSDWQRTGRADLRVSNDRHYYVRGGQEQMWAMTETPRLYTEAEGWRRYSLWGMGIASRDVTGDGFSDVFLTSMGDQKFQSYEPEAGGPSYKDATYDRGTTAHRPYTGGDGRPSTGWHAAFADMNNDGLDDVFIAKGNVEQMPDAAMRDPNNLLLQRPDGRFEEQGEAAGLATMARSRGAAVVDLDLDGRLDLAVVNRRAEMELYRNVTEGGGSLLVALEAPAPNTLAIGAFIELRGPNGVQTREVTIGGGHAGGSAGWHHFGMGEADQADLRVIWPGGNTSDWQTVQPGQKLTLRP